MISAMEGGKTGVHDDSKHLRGSEWGWGEERPHFLQSGQGRPC